MKPGETLVVDWPSPVAKPPGAAGQAPPPPTRRYHPLVPLPCAKASTGCSWTPTGAPTGGCCAPAGARDASSAPLSRTLNVANFRIGTPQELGVALACAAARRIWRG